MQWFVVIVIIIPVGILVMTGTASPPVHSAGAVVSGSKWTQLHIAGTKLVRNTRQLHTARSITISDIHHPLHNRRVFWFGYGFVRDFVTKFLQIKQSHMKRYTEWTPSTPIDVLVVSGGCNHCSAFRGLLVYIDGEAGHLQLKPSKNMIYMGVSHNKYLRRNTPHIKLMYGVCVLRYSSSIAEDFFFHRNVNVTDKNKFVAYAASNCVQSRENVFDALVNLSNNYNLGQVTAYGRCHGSPKYAYTRYNESTESAISTSRVTLLSNHMDNHIHFKNYRFVLCMENKNVEHYITEKIFNAYRAGAIPIYWGSSELVRALFHPDSLVLVDPTDPRPAMARVLQIQQDPVLYHRVLSTPILRHGRYSLQEYFAVNISLASACNSSQREHSLSNHIWFTILQRLSPLSSGSSRGCNV